MIRRTRHREATTEGDNRPKWLNSPVRFHKGTLTDIRGHIPEFERHSFALSQPNKEWTRINERLDMIIRKPFGEDLDFIPVGVVSKEYVLVPHHAVLDEAAKALEVAKIPLGDVEAELTITEYGQRMALSLRLPEQYAFNPSDGHPMALRLECFNSVDGSTRFRALMGWFRFVCSNGLVIGVTRSDVRYRHLGDLRVSDIGMVLTSGLEESEAEKKNFQVWRDTAITLDRIADWVNSGLWKGWGFKAAARTFHIARTGVDAEIAGQYKDTTPTTIVLRKTKPVPGVPKQCGNLFDLSQILAWLARERRDIQEQMEWREKIPELMKPLTTEGKKWLTKRSTGSPINPPPG